MSKSRPRSPVSSTGQITHAMETKKQNKTKKECKLNSRCGSFTLSFSDVVNFCGLTAFLLDDSLNTSSNLSADAKERIEGISLEIQILIQLVPVILPFVFLLLRMCFGKNTSIEKEHDDMEDIQQIVDHVEDEPSLRDLLISDDSEDLENPIIQELNEQRKVAAAAIRATNAFHKKINLMSFYTFINSAYLAMCLGEAGLLLAELLGKMDEGKKKSITDVTDNIYEIFNILYAAGTFGAGFWMSRKISQQRATRSKQSSATAIVKFYSPARRAQRDDETGDYEAPPLELASPLLGSGGSIN